MPNLERQMDARHEANMKTASAVRALIRWLPKSGAVIVTSSSDRKSFIDQMLREHNPDLAKACRVLIIRDRGTTSVLLGMQRPTVVDPSYAAPEPVKQEVDRLARAANVVANFQMRHTR